MFIPFGFMSSPAAAPPVGYDTDAQAFFTAVEGGGDTLTTTEKDGTNQLVLDFKSSGVWSKLQAFYPLVGSTSTSCKWNLMDPRDLDAAFRLTYITLSAFTFSTKGWKQNGTSGAGVNTHYVPAVDGIANNFSAGLSIYDNPGLSGNNYDMGVYDGSIEIALIGGGFNSSLNTSYFKIGGVNFITKAVTQAESESTWIIDTTSSTSSNIMFRNGTSWSTQNEVAQLSNFDMGLGCTLRSTGAEAGSNRGYSMFFLGESLDASGLITSFQSAINTWNTTLGKTP